MLCFEIIFLHSTLFLVVSVVPLVNPTLTPFLLELYSQLWYNLIDKAKIEGENMYEHKEKYTIDFTDVKNFLEMHFVIKEALDFPDYYGCNWDAFWDCITDFIDSRGLDLEIIGLDKIYSEFKEDVDILVELLKDLKHIYNDKYADVVKIVIHHGNSKVELT